MLDFIAFYIKILFENLRKLIMRFIFRFMGSLIGLVTLAVALGYFCIPIGIQLYLKSTLSLNVEKVIVSANQLTLNGLRDDDGVMTADSLSVYFNLQNLLSGEFSRLEIEGLNLVVEAKDQQESSFDAGVWIDFLDNPPITIGKILIKNARIKLEQVSIYNYVFSPININLMIYGSLAKNNKSSFKAVAEIPANDNLAGGKATLSIQWPKVVGEFKVYKLQHHSLPFVLDLIAKAEYNYGSVLSFIGAVDEGINKGVLVYKGRADPIKNIMDVRFILKDVKINSTRFPVEKFWPEMSKKLESYYFEAGGSGEVLWDGTRLASKGAINIKRGAFVYDVITVNGLQTQLSLDSLIPAISLSGQEIKIKQVAVPIGSVEDVSLICTHNPQKIEIDKVNGKIWGGDFSLASVKIDPLPKEQLLKLDLNNISLQKLISDLELADLKAEGKMSGEIPIRLFDDSSFAIEEALLSTLGNGFISYHWQSALSSDDSNIRLTAQAIDNFVYDEAKLFIRKPRFEELSLILDLKGKNPKLLEGRPFEIKFNISGDVMKALDATIKAFQGDIKHFR